nr:hypothetical protein [Aliiroseovarius subalbicans]
MAALALCLPAPALALSCMPYHVSDAYRDAAASADAYVIVRGVLSFDEGLLPKVDWEHQQDTPQNTLFEAQFDGHALTRNGFFSPFTQPIQVDVQCFGPWCSHLTSGQDYLAFLKQTEGGFLLETNPCGGFAFGQPSKDMLRQVQTCQRGGRCPRSSP